MTEISIVGDGCFETVAQDGKIVVRQKWISVKDKKRLPDPYKHVLVNGEDGVFRAYRDSNNNEYPSWQCYPIGSYAGDGCVFGITHWMPLPETPKG